MIHLQHLLNFPYITLVITRTTTYQKTLPTLLKTPQQGSSITSNYIVQNTIQTQPQPVNTIAQTTLRTPPCNTAQTSTIEQPLFAVKTIHTNPQLQPTTSRTRT